ncbi:alpha/beta fold hydrolase [Cryptosporangium sp. NPDC048952]|uniref:alpha/beta fold hydrolase n=1 Tax=Cryptosporangium sp. NPDC048952 TaxID=3363961 RepID=UPI00371CB571
MSSAKLRSVETSVVAADGTRIVVRRSGRGRPVVLVHPTAGGLDSWAPVTPLVEDSYECWVYARRGYAPSDGCRSPKTFADDVGDLRAVLELAGGSAAVVGASYGAIVALHAAGVPGVEALVLFEPPLFAAGTDVVDEYRDLVAAGDLAAATYLFADKVARVPSSLLAALAPERGAAADPGAPAEAVGSLHDLEALAADPGDVERWADIGVPVQLLQGGDSWEPIPSTMDALARVLPKAPRVVFPGHLHFATHTAPDLFADAVRSFLG